MNKFLLSICALAVVASPVWAEDQDQPKQKSKTQTQTAPQRPVAPRTVPQPRVQQNVPANTQLQNRNKPYVAPRTYTPKTFAPKTQAPNRTQTQTFNPPDQDAARANVPSKSNPTANTQWQNRNRNRDNTNVVT